jgi:hypothetical protein
MMEDFSEQWRRLAEHYGQMLDGELLRLAGQYGDLTETARQALRGEMLKRGLGDPTKPEEVQKAPGRFRFERGVELEWDEDSAGDAEDGDRPHGYTWKTELCECESREQAWQLHTVLKRAGIETWLDPNPLYLRIEVAADQLEEARRIIAQPIPQEIIEESQMEVPEYAAPKCPGCGDPDPTLLEGEPVNRWGCEVCGREWADAEALPEGHA